MGEFKVIQIKKSVFENNDREADKLREELKAKKTFLLNLNPVIPSFFLKFKCHRRIGQ